MRSQQCSFPKHAACFYTEKSVEIHDSKGRTTKNESKRFFGVRPLFLGFGAVLRIGDCDSAINLQSPNASASYC
jgi:hypothetical protein